MKRLIGGWGDGKAGVGSTVVLKEGDRRHGRDLPTTFEYFL